MSTLKSILATVCFSFGISSYAITIQCNGSNVFGIFESRTAIIDKNSITIIGYGVADHLSENDLWIEANGKFHVLINRVSGEIAMTGSYPFNGVCSVATPKF